MKQRHQLIIGIAISVIFLVIFLRNTNFTEASSALTAANKSLIAVSIVVYFVGVWVRSFRWKLLMKPLAKLNANSLFSLVTIGLMVNDILPGRLGIVARGYMIGEKKGISKLASGATVITENILDGLALILILLVGILLIPTPALIKTIGWIAAALFGGVFIVMLIVTYSENRAQLIVHIVTAITPKKWKVRMSNWVNLFISGLAILRSPGELIMIFLVSLVVWLCESGTYYLVALSMNIVVPFYAMLLVTAIGSLSWTLIIISPGGLGTFDAIVKYTLTEALGVASGLALAYTVAIHAILLIPVIILGFVFLARENMSLREITKARKATKEEVSQ